MKEQELLWKKKTQIQELLCELIKCHDTDELDDAKAREALSTIVGRIDICKSIAELAWILEKSRITPPKYQHLYEEKKDK